MRHYILVMCVLLLLPMAVVGRDKKEVKARTTSPASSPDALPIVSVGKVQLCAQPALPALSSNRYLGKRYVEGIDVSRYQGVIDWKRVAESRQIGYAYVKATEGERLVDRMYRKNLVEARKTGLRVGSYHFYRPNVNWKRQAKHMKKHVKAQEQDLIPIVDVEVRGRVSHAKFIRDLKRFVEEVEQYYGRKPLLYTYQNFYNKHLVGHFDGYQWMIARYRMEVPTLSDGTNFMMWQYTDSGIMDGVNGCVDRSCLMDGFRLHMLEL